MSKWEFGVLDTRIFQVLISSNIRKSIICFISYCYKLCGVTESERQSLFINFIRDFQFIPSLYVSNYKIWQKKKEKKKKLQPYVQFIWFLLSRGDVSPSGLLPTGPESRKFLTYVTFVMITFIINVKISLFIEKITVVPI